MRTIIVKPGVVVHILNPSTWEAEVEDLRSSRIAWLYRDPIKAERQRLEKGEEKLTYCTLVTNQRQNGYSWEHDR